MPSAAASYVSFACQCESPELAAPKRRSSTEAVAVRLELVDEAAEGRAVAEAEAVDVEGHPGERAAGRLAAGSLDALLHADERGQQAASALHVPDTVELGHG
jgi:hypothetical protein